MPPRVGRLDAGHVGAGQDEVTLGAQPQANLQLRTGNHADGLTNTASRHDLLLTTVRLGGLSIEAGDSARVHLGAEHPIYWADGSSFAN
jgi:hypothetical protein